MTPTLTMYQVDAFADRLFTGNPAAVLVLDEWLPDETMQALAAENNLAETAFARRQSEGFDLRWFTPQREVDFCGHATLATAHVLAAEMDLAGTLRFATRVGELRVTPVAEGYRMDFPLQPPVPLKADDAALDGLFAVRPRSFFQGPGGVFAELPDEAAIRSFVPDLWRIAELDGLGLCITAPGERTDFVSRFFAPGAGIDEDPVTGSIHATLAPFWGERLGKSRLSAFQASARGGRLDCELADPRVLITGRALTFMRAEIRLSPA